MERRSRDLLILAAVALAVMGGAELLFQLQSWDDVQTCFSLDRDNCVPRIFMREWRQLEAE
jgi:hypothetical protein